MGDSLLPHVEFPAGLVEFKGTELQEALVCGSVLVWALLLYANVCVPHVLMDISVSDFFFCRLKHSCCDYGLVTCCMKQKEKCLSVSCYVYFGGGYYRVQIPLVASLTSC